MQLVIHEYATINLPMGEREVIAVVIVVSPLTTEDILGTVFLQKYEAHINLPSQHLILTDPGTILYLQKFLKLTPSVMFASVRAPKMYEIPTMSDLEIMAGVKNCYYTSETWLMKEATS